MEERKERTRCGGEYWRRDDLILSYHDEEWGRPCHDEHALYALFVLELFQAGLSWRTLLKKRENFERAFDGFSAEAIAAYDEQKVEELMQDAGIIRNRRKIEAAITNAQVVLKLREEFGSFSAYLWHFTDGNSITEPTGVTRDDLSDVLARDLKRRGMRFCGSVTIYSFLQAAGIVYCHEPQCFCYARDHAQDFENNHFSKERGFWQGE